MQGNAKAALSAAGFAFWNRGLARINDRHTAFSHDGKFTIKNDNRCCLAYADTDPVRMIQDSA